MEVCATNGALQLATATVDTYKFPTFPWDRVALQLSQPCSVVREVAMGEKLQHSPLIEAICEFRFRREHWHPALREAFFAPLAAEFSVASEAAETMIDVDQGQIETRQRWRRKRPNDSAMIQIAPGVFAVNNLRPYDRWEVFRELIVQVATVFAGVAPAIPVERVSLRYLNQLPVPLAPKRVRDMLTVTPRWAGPLERPMRGVYQRYVFDHADVGGVLIHQVGLAPRAWAPGPMPGNRPLLLDLTFGSTRAFARPNGPDVVAWLNEAHDRIGAAFVASLTQDQYAEFRGAVG